MVVRDVARPDTSGASLGEIDRYYQRIAPVVPAALSTVTIGVTDPARLAQVVDSLARSGVLSWRLASGGKVARRDPLAEVLGTRWVGIPAGLAMAKHLVEHNRLEGRWDIRVGPWGPDEVDLILSTDPEDALEPVVPVVVPLVMDRVAATGVLVSTPGQPCPGGIIEKTLSMAEAPPLLDLLEAGDMAALAVVGLLGREPGSIWDLGLARGRCLVLRGSGAWPWEVALLGAGDVGWLQARAGVEILRHRVPEHLLARAGIMVVGCGTASNWLPYLYRRAGALCLVDYKDVSPFNPVRQLPGTDFVGKGPKPHVLVDVLARRQGVPRAAVAAKVRPEVLRITWEDHASVDRFRALLEDFSPDVVVVGIGRPGGDEEFLITDVLRGLGIRQLVSTAFPAVTHFKHVLVDGSVGPPYDTLGAASRRGAGPTPELSDTVRAEFYGGTQPASLVRTMPSVHSGLRLLEQLALPWPARARWFQGLIHRGHTCLVGANLVGGPPDARSYGVALPFQVVAFGPALGRAAPR